MFLLVGNFETQLLLYLLLITCFCLSVYPSLVGWTPVGCTRHRIVAPTVAAVSCSQTVPPGYCTPSSDPPHIYVSVAGISPICWLVRLRVPQEQQTILSKTLLTKNDQNSSLNICYNIRMLLPVEMLCVQLE